jgi:hypothetical protein
VTTLADPPAASPEVRVLELEDRLERERARNAGLERGIEALTARVAALQAENARLREPRVRGTAADRRRQPRSVIG